MSIGKILIAAGTILGFFGGQYAQASAFLIQVGTDILAGGGKFGPIRLGNESISGTVGPWTGP
jgi:hypothetical protein